MTSPGTRTRPSQGDHRAVAQRVARLIQAGSEPRELRMSCDPAIGAKSPQPRTKVANSASRVQPQPIVDTSAMTPRVRRRRRRAAVAHH